MRKIAIIGAGPRGLSALENLFIHLSENGKEQDVVVSIFDTSETPGTGNIWNMDQPKTNWINSSERALKKLAGRVSITLGDHNISEFPSYTKWLPEEEQQLDASSPDRFPGRSKFGRYLNERFLSIAVELQMAGYLKIFRSEVIEIDFIENLFSLKTSDDAYEFDEVLLCIGHQPTIISNQLKKWIEHVKTNSKLQVFDDAYPVEKFMRSEKINDSSTVAIRGFGLTMIDIVRALSIGKGGEFDILNPKTFRSKFVSSSQMPKKIVVFSINGKPLVPKPLNADIDSKFEPTEEEIVKFGKTLSKYTQGEKEVLDDSFLKEAIAEIASRVYLDLQDKSYSHDLKKEAIATIIIEWLSDDNFKHDLILPTSLSATRSIKQFLNMALGEDRISLDYCIGQVWRHCQSQIYNELSHSNLEDSVIEIILALHARMERYSYGPPVESMQQLLSLVDSGKLDLDLVEDPEITEVKNGWKLENNRSKCIAQIIINCVLDDPRILEVSSPLICNLLSNELIKPIYSELGIKTTKDGIIKTHHKNQFIPLAVMGRLANGSVIGVDSISECFGPRIKDWAKAAVKRVEKPKDS